MRSESLVMTVAMAMVILTGCGPAWPQTAQSAKAARMTPVPTLEPAQMPTEMPAGALSASLPTMASEAALDGVRVHGYLGFIRSAPAGAIANDGTPIDDYVQFVPEGSAPALGVAGASAEIEEQLAQARDLLAPDGGLNLYGTIACNVLDYNGCRLQVECIRLPTEQTNPEKVSGLSGRIVSFTSDSQYDDKLVLTEPLPVEIGVASAVFENGYPMLRDALAALRDSDRQVMLDGQIVSGADDVNGVQLQVTSLTVDGHRVDPLADWLIFSDAELGISMRYPP